MRFASSNFLYITMRLLRFRSSGWTGFLVRRLLIRAVIILLNNFKITIKAEGHSLMQYGSLGCFSLYQEDSAFKIAPSSSASSGIAFWWPSAKQ